MIQKKLKLQAKTRGFHLITHEVLEQLPDIKSVVAGVLHLFIQHSSASLTINENADADVRGDMERFLLAAVPENEPYFQHTLEGPDDMPAHIKASLLGSSLLIPVNSGQLALGTWQGIWLGEHRLNAGRRNIIATITR